MESAASHRAIGQKTREFASAEESGVEGAERQRQSERAVEGREGRMQGHERSLPNPGGMPGPGPGAMTKVVPLSSQQIQQLLEDNAVILKAITESQSLGRWEECEK